MSHKVANELEIHYNAMKTVMKVVFNRPHVMNAIGLSLATQFLSLTNHLIKGSLSLSLSFFFYCFFFVSSFIFLFLLD